MRLVVLGDSLSDQGNKQHTLTGRLARVMNEARINKAGRFSDSKVWPDFVWEWAGGDSLIRENAGRSQELTRSHLSLEGSKNGSNNDFSFVNYSVGGAVIEESEKLKYKMGLTTIDEQKEKYFRELDEEHARTNRPPDDTVHVIWAGLNDTVTDGKDPAEMEGLVNKIEQITNDTREKFIQYGGSSPRFMIVNNPSPQEAVRFINDRDDDKIVRAQQANDRFNELLRQRFPNSNNMAFVDMNDLLKEENLYPLRLMKASQNHGQQVQYEAPYKSMDTSLGNILREFGEHHQGNEEGRKIYDRIQTPLKDALRTDNEALLHQQVGNIIIDEMKRGNNSNEVNAIRDALMVTGTYPNQIDFATQYYQAMHNDEKHSADINEIQTAVNNIYKQSVPTQLHNDLNAADTELYNAVSRSLLNSMEHSSKNSTYRNLIADVTANNFGFVSTSDGVHPTQALHQIMALKIAETMINDLGVVPSNNFANNVLNAYADAGIFRPDNPLSTLNEELPSEAQQQQASMDSLQQQQQAQQVQMQQQASMDFSRLNTPIVESIVPIQLQNQAQIGGQKEQIITKKF